MYKSHRTPKPDVENTLEAIKQENNLLFKIVDNAFGSSENLLLVFGVTFLGNTTHFLKSSAFSGNVMRLNISRKRERTRLPYSFSNSFALRLVVAWVIIPR